MRFDLEKTRLLHLGNVEKSPHPHFSAQRAPEGLTTLSKFNKMMTAYRLLAENLILKLKISQNALILKLAGLIESI